MTKYLLEIEVPPDGGDFTGKSLAYRQQHWKAKCPVCQADITGYDVQSIYQDNELSGYWIRVASHTIAEHHITFDPCQCTIHLPPDELEVRMGPTITGWEELAGLITEALEAEAPSDQMSSLSSRDARGDCTS